MVNLGMLWLPIVLSAVIVFVASFLMWMVLPHHKSDWGKVPQEDAVREALRRGGAGPGQYRVPHAQRSEMKSAEFQKKLAEGPVGLLVLRRPGSSNMGKSMALSFLHDLVISLLVGYLAAHALAPGVDYLAVFRVAGTAAILGYAGSIATQAIWFWRSWSSTCKEIVDGIVYGLLTAGVFGWLWP